VNPVVEATAAWRDWFQVQHLVVAGDFGSGWPLGKALTAKDWARWWGKPISQQHVPVCEALESLGLRSAYHSHVGVAQGLEPDATYWHNSSQDKPFHIDHIFTSPDLP
jgi:hypothetical protein